MDRKALIREYKESGRPMGVFRVRNTVNGKALVGTSTNLPAMLNRSRWQLSMGAHVNRKLQQEWNQFGPDAFAFEILDVLPIPERSGYDPSDDLRALEEMWLDKLSPFEDRGYNEKTRIWACDLASSDDCAWKVS
jgi:hypothetical protein